MFLLLSWPAHHPHTDPFTHPLNTFLQKRRWHLSCGDSTLVADLCIVPSDAVLCVHLTGEDMGVTVSLRLWEAPSTHRTFAFW